MEMVRTASTLMVDNIKEFPLEQVLREAKHKEGKDLPYWSLIGSMLYLSTDLRPDITFPVSTLCGLVKFPTAAHWLGTNHVVLYMKGTQKTGKIY